MKYSKPLNHLKKIFSFVMLTVVISTSALAQEISREYEQKLKEKTITFEAVNPYTNVPGNVTITVSGAFRGKRIDSGRKTGWSVIKGEQQGSFAFLPYDSSQPSFKGTFKFGLSGDIPFDRHSDVLPLSFIIKTVGTDGSEVTFAQSQFATVNEYGADVSFGELNKVDPEAGKSPAAKP